MVMNEEKFVKNSNEWLALNKIWKSCTAEQRNALHSEFELLSVFIRQNVSVTFWKQNFEYLNSLSNEAKQFVVSLIEKGEPNLYHSIMAILENKKGATKEDISDYYFKKYETKRPYLIEKRKLVNEVFELCWRKFRSK